MRPKFLVIEKSMRKMADICKYCREFDTQNTGHSRLAARTAGDHRMPEILSRQVSQASPPIVLLSLLISLQTKDIPYPNLGKATVTTSSSIKSFTLFQCGGNMIIRLYFAVSGNP